MTTLLKEFKPRKAKYGFSASIGAYNMLEVSELILLSIGKPEPKSEAWFMEYTGSYGASDLKVYVNDITVYERLKAANQSSAS